MSDKYILGTNHEVVRIDNLNAWARWIEVNENRVVKQETVGALYVSTVFLGLDYNISSKGAPILFETAAFGDDGAVEMWRCSTYIDAVAQHQRVVDANRQHDASIEPIDQIERRLALE